MGRALLLNASFEPLSVVPMRRAVVLVLKEKAEVIEHGQWQLHSEHTALARPVVILLSTGHNLAKLQEARPADHGDGAVVKFRPSTTFVPQKARAIRNAVIISAFGAVIIAVVFSYALVHFLG